MDLKTGAWKLGAFRDRKLTDIGHQNEFSRVPTVHGSYS